MRAGALIDRLATGQHAEHEQQLPGERVEIPVHVRRGGQVGVDRRRAGPQRDAACQQQPRLAARERQDHGHEQGEKRVHGQHGGQIGLTAEKQDVAQRGERGVDQVVEIRGGEIRPVDAQRGKRGADQQHQRGGDEKRPIDFQRAPQEAAARDRLVAPFGERGIGRGGGEAAEEHEDLGGVAQRIGVQRDARQNAAADVVDDDDQKNQPAKKIELYQAGLRLLHCMVPKAGPVRRRASPARQASHKAFWKLDWGTAADTRSPSPLSTGRAGRGAIAGGVKDDPMTGAEFRCGAAKKLSIIFLSVTNPLATAQPRRKSMVRQPLSGSSPGDVASFTSMGAEVKGAAAPSGDFATI
ncbi:protein of unknown function [Paraburkholderia dioscoreae]|uniref:Uncharacterized protein n=1 Tax=Paraburkholderia dioscoreae TaxID=2604047 RepID=A0A5Q4ZTN0_9BURK|nr:protein of unknown function [Paraburkholderia dioscoreae]